MASTCGTFSVRWSLYRDATCSDTAYVSSGVVAIDQMPPQRRVTTQNAVANASSSSCFVLASPGFQLVPAMERRVYDLIEWQERTRNTQTDSRTDTASEVPFPVAVEDLSIGSKAAALGLDDTEVVYCTLQAVAEDPPTAKVETVRSMQQGDWWSWKVERAAEYRDRGNDAFQHTRYRFAVQLYKRALAWLEPPLARSDPSMATTVQYSDEEAQRVTPLAVACYTNLATCYSKLSRDGDVDRCIAAASSALAMDHAHVKARYRRSQAYMASKAFDLALADLTKLRELEPDNRLFRSAWTKARAAKTRLRKKQQDAYATLLDK